MRYRQMNLGLVVLCAWGLSGCVTDPFAAKPTAPVSKRDAIGAGGRIERAAEGRRIAVGGGESMAPIYGDGTVIVTDPIAYEDLEVGMIVAFVNPGGIQVVHQLIRKEWEGWVTRGLNNFHEDSGFLTEANLIGVVYAVFQAE